MSLETVEDLDHAIARLAQRSPLALATFIGSLAHDSGPAGEHVRAFMLAESTAQAVDGLRGRILRLGAAPSSGSGCNPSANIAARWSYILDGIETTVMPSASTEAFDLLVRLIRCDGAALEASTDHDYEIALAVERAAALLAVATRSLPKKDVLPVLRQLLVDDNYGCRQPLKGLLEALAAVDGA